MYIIKVNITVKFEVQGEGGVITRIGLQLIS